jgi:hypothetical protein
LSDLDLIQRQVDLCVVHGGVNPTCLLVHQPMITRLANNMQFIIGFSEVTINGLRAITNITQAKPQDYVLEVR